MSTTIKLRRSAVPGRVPTTSQLDLGELAINTADGKIYFKQYDPVANTESIVDVSTNLDANAILDLLIGVDGANSGLDADLLDGQDGSYYLDWDNFTNTATGVSANTYGSASEVPVLTIDEDGRITAANTVTVAGVSNTYWDSSNNTYTIETADGGIYNTIIEDFSGLNIEGFAGKIRFNSTVAPEITNQDDTVRLVMFGDGYTPNTAQLYLYADTNVWVDTDLTVSGDINTTQDISANNIVVTGLVDGRDIAADGAKLDLLEDGLDLTLTGKVTGFASSNTGVMTLTTELANTGVVANTYGSSTEIPVFTVDEDGRITEANTTPVAGVDDFSYDASNNQITLTTGDGSVFNIQTETEVTLTGKVTGTATATDGNLSIATELANTGVVANTYGSSTEIPVLAIDEDGRITLANTASVAGVNDFYWTSANNTLTLETGDGSVYLVPIEEFNEITANTVNGRDITADGNKLDGIEDGAQVNPSNTEILNSIKAVDGAGSGLDADLLDGQHASDIIAAAVSDAGANVGNGRITITANNGLTGSGSFNLNDFSNTSIIIEHEDTSSVSDVSNANGSVIQSLTFDTFGHVQTASSTDLDSRYYSQSYIDSNFYNQTEADNRFVNVTGDTMTGELIVQNKITQNYASHDTATITTTATSQVPVYSFDYSTYGAAEILITAKEGSNRHITKLLVTHDGSTPIATEYGVVYTNSELATYDISFFGPALQILATPSSSSSTTFNVVITLINA